MVLPALVSAAEQLHAALMMAWPAPLSAIVSVPPPDKVTGPSIRKNVLSAAASIEICPEFEMLPAATSVWLSLMIRLSPLSIVSVPTVTEISSVTCEFTGLPSSMHTFVLELLGTTPVLQLAASLQFPVPPSQIVAFPVQFVPPGGCCSGP